MKIIKIRATYFVNAKTGSKQNLFYVVSDLIFINIFLITIFLQYFCTNSIFTNFKMLSIFHKFSKKKKRKEKFKLSIGPSPFLSFLKKYWDIIHFFFWKILHFKFSQIFTYMPKSVIFLKHIWIPLVFEQISAVCYLYPRDNDSNLFR